MVTDPAHELAKIRSVLERIALALESIARKTDPGFKTTAEQNQGAKRSASNQKASRPQET
jgi:hypothetical protein